MIDNSAEQSRTSRTRRQRPIDIETLAAAGEAPSASPPPSQSEVPPAPPPDTPQASQPVEEIEHAEEPALGGSQLRRHDVVQVTDQTSRLYGMFFIVGDVRHNKVHGYYIAEGRSKNFVTVPLELVRAVGGKALVRSSTPCSPKWIADNQ